MKALALAVVFALTMVGCRTSDPGAPPSVVSQVVDCGLSDVTAKLPSIVDRAATCLLAERSSAFSCLGRLAVDVGSDTAVVCGVRIASGEAGRRAATAPGEQPNADRVVDNGRAYLEARQVRFVQ